MNRIPFSERWVRFWPLIPAVLFALATGMWTRRVGLGPENFPDSLHAACGALDLINGRDFPLAFNSKTGPGTFYLNVPFLLIFGKTIRALRASALFWGAACVAATGFLAERCSGSRKAGILAACLMAATPSLGLFAATGHFGGCAETALAALALAEILACARDLRPARARRAGLLLGLALMTKPTIAPLVVGLLAGAVLFRPRWGRSQRRLVIEGAALFALLQIPYAWELAVGGLWRKLVPHLLVRGDGASNLAFFSSLAARARQFISISAAPVEGLPELIVLPAAVCAAGLGVLALRAFLHETPDKRRGPELLVVLCFAHVAISAFTPSFLRTHHLLPMMPLLWAAVATLLAASPPGMARKAAVLLAAGYMLAGASGAAATARALEHGDGSGAGIDSRGMDMARYFQSHPEASPVLVGGDRDNRWAVRFLTGRTPELFLTQPARGPEPRPEDWRRVFEDPSSLFAVAADDGGAVGGILRGQAAKHGRRLVRVAAVRGRSGPVYDFFSAQRTD